LIGSSYSGFNIRRLLEKTYGGARNFFK